jgi:hypothetical protein
VSPPGFKSPLVVQGLRYETDKGGRALWQVQQPLVFASETLGREITVPAGFITNYASVPRLPLIFLVAGDRSFDEAAVHDWLYTSHECTKDQADRVFLEALLLNPKIPAGLAQTMFKAVSWFGGGSWSDETSIQQPEHIRALIRQPPAARPAHIEPAPLEAP